MLSVKPLLNKVSQVITLAASDETFSEGDDIDAFITRFERTLKLYKIELEEMDFEVFSLFMDKALPLILNLESEKGSYEHIKIALRKVYDRTTKDTKVVLCNASIT